MKMREVTLSRVDVDEQPTLINNFRLRSGEHVIGRGPLLNCQSKRVSRNHGLIRVSELEGVFLTSTHHNPCFYLSKKTNHTVIVKNGTTVQINNDDQIALLPDKYWYKIEIFDIVDEVDNINNDTSEHIPNIPIKEVQLNNNGKRENKDIEQTSNKRWKLNGIENGEMDELETSSSNSAIQNCDIQININMEDNSHLSTIVNTDNYSSSNNSRSETPDLLNNEFNTTVERANENTNNDITNEVQNEAPTGIVMQSENEKELDQLDQQNLIMLSELQELPDSPNSVRDPSDPSSECGDEQQNIVTQRIDDVEQANSSSTIKVRSLEELQSVQVDVPAAGIKVLVIDKIKVEPEDVDGASSGGPQPSTSAQGRERCWFGNQCYRKNPQHKVQFSHPWDTDYGDAQRKPMCAFGAQCYRRNPRHRHQYDHPTPPANKPPDVNQKTKRPRKKKKVSQSEHEDEDDYDIEDPFIDDGSSDEYQMSSESSDSDDELPSVKPISEN